MTPMQSRNKLLIGQELATE